MRFALLGPLVVQDGTGNSATLSGPRIRVLLAALLLRANAPVAAESLAEAVWDGAPPSGAVQTLRSYVRRLRRALGPGAEARIMAHNPGYLIRVDESELDVLEFEALCRKSDTALRQRAWAEASATAARASALWRGTPLLDVSSQTLHAQFVPSLERLRVQVLEDRAEAELRLGHDDRVLPQLRDLTAQYPLRERFHAQLMFALARAGRRAEALEAYRQARRVLVGELGIEPGPELRELQERILAGDRLSAPRPAPPPDPAPVRAAPHQLPVAVPHFAGRSEELRTLSDLLERAASHGGTVVLCAIGGTAGIGKSALAIHWGRQVADSFPDGQLYVNLRGFDPTGPPAETATVARGFLDALGVPPARIPADPDAQMALYRSRLDGTHTLIVLDNARDESQVRPLLPGAPGCLTLVTSRNQLAGLVALDGAVPLALDLLTPREARDLLAHRLGPARIADDEAVGELIELCARLPLALNIAASRAVLHPDASLNALVQDLRDAGRRLVLLSAGESAADLRSVFSWSYRALSPPAAHVFRLLGLHPGPDVGLAAVASLAAADHDRARDALDELTALHLVTEQAPGRYSLHDLLRAYAAELAHTHEFEADRCEARYRLFDHYLNTARSATVLLNPGWLPLKLPAPRLGVRAQSFADREQARGWYQIEHATLLAVISGAAESGFDSHAWQLAWAFAAHLEPSGYQRDLLATSRIALAAAERSGDLAGQAYAHRRIGQVLTLQHVYPDADTHLHKALGLYEQLDDRLYQGNCHITIAFSHEKRNQFVEALIHANRALELFSATDYKGGQSHALNSAGWYEAELGRHDEGLSKCKRALHLARAIGDQRGEAHTLDSIGYVYRKIGDHDAAVTYYSEASALHLKLGNRYFCAVSSNSLGDALGDVGEHTAARDAWRRALTILDDLQHPDAEAVRAKLAVPLIPPDAANQTPASRWGL